MESGESSSKNDGIWNDPRFSHLINDPRFKQLPKNVRKVKIDKRFQSMFNDSKFKIKYTVDKYGRKVDQTSSEDLKKYYDIESSTDEEDEEAERREEEKQIAKIDSNDDDTEQNDELSHDGVILSTDIKKKLVDSEYDYARGEGRLLTDSSSDEETSSDNDDDEIFIEHVWGELDNDAPRTDQSTYRLAACNMDWDRIRASDIMVLCNSFLPPGGSILNVKIYPSEFGKQRMVEEELNGPPELAVTKKMEKNSGENDENKSDSESEKDDLIKNENSDVEEGDDYHMEKLRQYQLNRLKYYYAVIECNSVDTADKLYKECDGLEYESTATKFDLRFVPDDVTFDDDDPKDVCTELPDLSKYKPRLFTTTALQQAKVDLTWDETSIERKELREKLASGKLDEINPADLKNFVAYSSSEEEEEEEINGNEESNSENSSESEDNDSSAEEKITSKKKKEKDSISKYKQLLEDINKKEQEQKRNKFEIECSWTIDANTKDSDEDEKNIKDKKNMTPIEKILEKRREKNKRRKEEKRKKLKGNDNDEDSSDDDDIPDGVDMTDPYFAEEFANGNFKPSKKSKQKSSKNKEDKSRRRNDDVDDERKTKELELLLDDNNDNKKHFSLKEIQDAETETKSKRKRKKQLKKSKQNIESINKTEIDDNFQININDERFKALYTSHLFNIDPSDSHFKKTKGMEKLIDEKLKRRYNDSIASNNDEMKSDNDEIQMSKKPKKIIENNILIKNLKRKIEGKYS